ncbi:hypothetical protein QRE66_09265 [Bacillus cereus]|nr:hypothetical protein QRE66_09265 [Bacillus cereus]
MEVRSVLNSDKNYKVEVTERYTFDVKTNLERYKELFEGMKKTGYVKAHSFSDITWYLPCPVKYKDIQFNFSVGRFNSFSSSLKSFVLLRRKSGKKPSTIKDDLKRLKTVIIETEGLRDAESIKEFFLTPRDTNETYRMCYTLVNYLEFNPIPSMHSKVKEIFEGLKYPTYSNRDLPPFEDVLTFDDCINRYFRENSLEDTVRFYPLYLWWSITNIIPMRVIEFLRIKRDCLKEKDDGSFWITIPRYKLNSSSLEETHWEHTLLIDANTHRLVENYVFKLREMNIDSEYLIPPLNWINDRFRTSYTVSDDVTNGTNFNNLIRFFYEEMVEEQFGEIGLSPVTAGDTRHFAIMNLFLQGFNVLTITRLAGHDEISSPSNYFTHAKHYATSFVYKLAQRKVEGGIGSAMGDGFIGVRAQKVREAQVKKSFEEDWRRVEFGFCKDTDNFPRNCIEDCRLCDFYAFRPSVGEWGGGIKWLESYSQELEQHMTDTLNLLATVSTDTYEKLKGIEKINETESKALAVQFFKYLDHKAIIDARIMEEKEEDESEN